jgi:hypothetical protein
MRLCVKATFPWFRFRLTGQHRSTERYAPKVSDDSNGSQSRPGSAPRSAAPNSLDGLVCSAAASFATFLTVGFRTPRSTPET